MANKKYGIFKRLFQAYIFVNIIRLGFAGKDISLPRQNMILSLSNDLYVKNIILLKTSPEIDSKTISFAKSVFKSNIYFTLLSAKKIESLMDDLYNSKVKHLKSIILTFKQEFNHEIYDLITRNVRDAHKFLWLVWDKTNEVISKSDLFFNIPYNTQLLISEDVNKDFSCISEIYHPRIYSPVMFTRHFGTWSENKGIEIPEKDLYKRRFDMNETEIVVSLKNVCITGNA